MATRIQTYPIVENAINLFATGSSTGRRSENFAAWTAAISHASRRISV